MMSTIGLVLLLTWTCALFTGSTGQVFHFDQEISHKDTCGANPETDWSTDGSVTLTSGDLVAFQQKVVISASKELCTVDLTSCPPANVSTSKPACYCVSKHQDKYKINIGSRTNTGQAGMSLQASVPGYGALESIQGVTTIGTLPNRKGITSNIRATYTLGDNRQQDLLDSQTVDLCPRKQFILKVCVENSHPNAELRIMIGQSSVNSVGGCVSTVSTFSPSQFKTVFFQYKPPTGCTHVKRIDLKEDNNACSKGIQTSDITGPCPNTPRRIVTLPYGNQALMDETSMGHTWMVIQRRSWFGKNFENRNLDHYKEGYGDMTGDFWIGLPMILGICNLNTKCALLINLQYHNKPYDDDVKQAAGGCYYAHYAEFYLSESGYYRINIKHFNGTAGDSMLSGITFSNYDESAWWYTRSRSKSDLNRGYWETLTGPSDTVSFSEMKVRRLV